MTYMGDNRDESGKTRKQLTPGTGRTRVNIGVRVADPGDAAANRSLLNWLLQNSQVREKAPRSVGPAGPDTMGGSVEAIQIMTLDSAFQLVDLALAFSQWRRDSKSAAPVVVRSASGLETTLSLDALKDERAVYRALSGAPDPLRSHCVLIGVSDYAELEPLPAVSRNLTRLEVLTDPAIWGVPAENLHKVEDPGSIAAVSDKVRVAAEKARDTLLVYYAGHGLYDADDGLHLALPDATEGDLTEAVRRRPGRAHSPRLGDTARGRAGLLPRRARPGRDAARPPGGGERRGHLPDGRHREHRKLPRRRRVHGVHRRARTRAARGHPPQAGGFTLNAIHQGGSAAR